MKILRPVDTNALLARVPDLAPFAEVAIDLEVTSVCDAVCTFCPREVMPDKTRFISREVVDRLAEELRRVRVKHVVLCGIGESTLHPELDHVVKTITDTGTRVEMTSHGGKRLTGQRFAELAALGLVELHVSLNAWTAGTHNRVMKLKDFDVTMANLQELLAVKERDFPEVGVNVSMVVCDANVHEVEPFVRFWREQPVKRVWLHPLNSRAGLRSEDVKPVDLAALSKTYAEDGRVLVDVFGYIEEKERMCKVAEHMMFISAEGEMRLCAMDYRRITSYGNILRNGLDEMHRLKLATFLSGNLDEFCGGCDFCPPAIKDRQQAVAGA